MELNLHGDIAWWQAVLIVKAEVPVMVSFDLMAKDEGACVLNVCHRYGRWDPRFL